MASINGSSDDRLDGWKEISSYLGRNVRTCQRWEKENQLPVYRINEKLEKSKVFSFRSELDSWFLRKQNHTKKASLGSIAGMHRLIFVLAGFTAVVLALVILTGIWKSHPENPVKMEVRGNQMAFFDVEDQLLWNKEVDNPTDQTKYYNDNESRTRGFYLRDSLYLRSRHDFADIDRDGKYEVACALNHEDPRARCVALYDNWGKELWARKVLLEQKYAAGDMPRDHYIVQVKFADIDEDGRVEILVLWASKKRFSSIFLIYNRKGGEEYRYVHTGVLQFFKEVKMGDKGVLIFLGGTNNLLDKDAVLSVLDCRRLSGETAPPYELPPDLDSRDDLKQYIPIDPEPADHAYYIRFRKTSLCSTNHLTIYNVMSVNPDEKTVRVSINQDGKFDQIMHYNFDHDFIFKDVTFSSECEARYQELLEAGSLSEPLEVFRNNRRGDISFWNNGGWTFSPHRPEGY